MKKSILFLLIGLISLCFVNQSCSNSEAAIPAKAKVMNIDSLNASLKWLGFGNVGSVHESNKDRIKNTYGLNFISADEMDFTLAKNNFIIASSTRYIGTIPLKYGELIVTNFNKVIPEQRYSLWNDIRWEKISSFNDDKGIYVAAPQEYFTVGAVITRTDPIVLVRVDYGWIELARW